MTEEITGQEPNTEQAEGQEPEVEQQGTELDDMQAIQAELNRARREAAKYRKAAKAAEEAEELRKREEMSEVERLKADMAKIQAQAQEAEAQAKMATIKAAVMRAANGFNDPEDALRLLDLDAMEIDDDGNIEGLEDAIAGLLKTKPYLAKKQGGITPTNPAAERQPMSYADVKARSNGRALDYMFGTGGGGVTAQEE